MSEHGNSSHFIHFIIYDSEGGHFQSSTEYFRLRFLVRHLLLTFCTSGDSRLRRSGADGWSNNGLYLL